MKKCYLVPQVHFLEIELESLMASSPFDGSDKIEIGDGTPEAGSEVDMETRQRGNDFGSLW